MNPPWLAFSVSTLVVAAVAVPWTARPQAPTFQSSVEIVRLDVLATRDGRPITGLSAGDFEVRDNGVEQRVDLFSAEEVPIGVLLVLDTSTSVRGSKWAALVEAARAALDGLRHGDRAGLLAFSHELYLAAPVSGDLDAVRSALERMEPVGRTALVDAVHAAATLDRTGGDRALALVFTDGFDTSSWLRPESVIETLRRSESVLYGVTTTPLSTIGKGAGVPDYRASMRSFLADAADTTGGRVLEAKDPSRLRETFTAIIEEFKARYLLSYVPDGVSRTGWHTVQVRLRRGRRGEITARPGYFVASPVGRQPEIGPGSTQLRQAPAPRAPTCAHEAADASTMARRCSTEPTSLTCTTPHP